MLRMGDSTVPRAIPGALGCYAGYIDGQWASYSPLVALHPGLPVLSIATSPMHRAQVLDIESGDARIADAPGWCTRYYRATRPRLYTSIANAAALITAMANAGWARPRYFLWTAHYTGVAHLCSPACGYGMPTTADATQWVDHGQWDESLATEAYVTGGMHTMGTASSMASHPSGQGYWIAGSDGAVFAYGAAAYHGGLGQVDPSRPPGGANAVAGAAPVVGMTATPDGRGYWLVAADGGVYAFGSAQFHGSIPGSHATP